MNYIMGFSLFRDVNQSWRLKIYDRDGLALEKVGEHRNELLSFAWEYMEEVEGLVNGQTNKPIQ